MVRIIITLLACTTFIYSQQNNPTLHFIKKIGHTDERFAFFRVNESILLPNNHLLVADSKRHSLMLYDWNGDFLKKFGRRGQGPGDFLSFNSLRILGMRIYTFDPLNKRLTSINAELTDCFHKKLIGFHSQGREVKRSFTKFFKLDDQLYLGILFSDMKQKGRLCIVDPNFNILKYFYSDSPLRNKIEEGAHIFLVPVVCINDFSKTILVTLSFPDTKIVFRKYSFSGDFMGSFSYRQDGRFTFSSDILDFATEKKDQFPREYHIARIIEIMTFQNHYLVVMRQYDKDTHTDIARNKLLIFSPHGKLKHTFEIDPTLKIHSISKDGYLVCSKFDDDEENYFVYIYQLKI